MAGLGEKISNYILRNFGEDYLANYLRFIESDYTPYLRVSGNADKTLLVKDLKAYGIELKQHPEIPYAFEITKGKENAGKTIEFTVGKYYIQSLSSMIPPLVLNPEQGDRVLDLSAAPGSKTTQLSQIMKNTGTLIANDPNLNRVKALAHNIDKMNCINVGILKIKGELLSKYSEEYFDKALVDAPCSALGILQKKGEVSGWWNEKQVEKIAYLQIKLLISAIKTLKIGGEIVYSTCTLTLEENEMVINTILKKYPVELVDISLPVKAVEGFTDYAGVKLNLQLSKTRRIVPWEINSEGFFIAKLRKTGKTEPKEKFELPIREMELLGYENKKVRKYLEQIGRHFGIDDEIFKKYKYLIKKREIFIVNGNWESPLINLMIRTGIPFATIDKRDFAQLHSHGAQILSKEINKNLIGISGPGQLRNYFAGSSFSYPGSDAGQKAVKFKKYMLGTGIVTDGKIKSQFPRSKRTHDIIIPMEI